jgi:hypothetical protein
VHGGLLIMAVIVATAVTWSLGQRLDEDRCLDAGYRFVVSGPDRLCEADDGQLSALPPLTWTARVVYVSLWAVMSAIVYVAMARFVRGGRP